MQFVLLLATLLAMLSSVRARAAVTGLINTGADERGSLLTIGSIQEGWSIVSVAPPQPPGGLTPSTPPSNAYVVDSYLNWMPNSSSPASAWISYQYPLYVDGDESRQFTYALNFTAEPGDAFLMRMAADNGGSAYLNDAASGPLADWGFDPSSGLHFQLWSPWIAVADLADGENTLLFVVNNLSSEVGNPTGLRVEFAAIPEPSVSLLWAAALCACWAKRVLSPASASQRGNG